jgi:hypothetical protein
MLLMTLAIPLNSAFEKRTSGAGTKSIVDISIVPMGFDFRLACSSDTGIPFTMIMNSSALKARPECIQMHRAMMGSGTILYNCYKSIPIIGKMWRRRVEVESTIRPAKGRIAGFEGREGHRTPFAPC